MNDKSDLTPSADEVLAALDNILSSVYFTTSDRQSELLRFVVEQALAGEAIKAIHIFTRLYGETNIDLHKVKSTANHVRGKLNQYHAGEGSNDLVRIELPPGPGYRPEFTYNFESGALSALKRGLAVRDTMTDLALIRAQVSFSEARGIEFRYAPIHEAIAENELLKFVLDHIFNNLKTPHPNEDEHRYELLDRVFHFNSKSWRGMMVSAWYFGFKHEWDKARERFEKAAEFNEKQVSASLSYAAYLIIAGKQNDGIGIVERNVAAFPESVGVALLSAFLFYLARRYRRLNEQLIRLNLLVEHSDLCEVMKTLSYLANPETAHIAIAPMSRISLSTWNGEFTGQPAFPGLAILCHVRAGQVDQARVKWEVMRKQASRKPLQFAIAYMAIGRYGRALICVWRAYRQLDIFTNLIHIMPLFDPLRQHPRFAEMVQKFTTKYGFDSSRAI